MALPPLKTMSALVVTVRIIQNILYLYMLILLARVVIDWIFFFSRDLRPKGPFLVVVNLIYALTDKPMRFFSRMVPPVRLGTIALDLGVLLLFFVIYLAQVIIGLIPYWLS